MSFSINTNIASLQAQYYLTQTSNFQNTTIQQVTSGLRIVNSGTDAAGLAVANGYSASEAVLTQGILNANSGLSQLQIADGGISNITQLLNRASTLATESASGTFTGDRSILNNEFQSVLGQINQQAQAIGLNQGGTFAKDLSVFIGGGQASGNISATQNGTVSLNLSQATVDTKSLGLTGVEAVNPAGADLSSASATSVQNIVQDANNAQPNNSATFDFSGPGFSDGSKVAISVNLNGVTDVNTLVTAVNAAIQSAGSGASAAATAFKNADITARVYTDANGGQHLAFDSGSSAFQVQAGDVMSNALLGNTTSASNPDGAAIASTTTGSANASGAALGAAATVQIQGGGLASPVDITLAAGQTIADLQTAVANNSALKQAGITLSTATSGSPLVFTSATGQKLNVQAAGDTANVLGLGSFQYGASNAVDYNTITAGANYAPATANGTANLEFSINGGPTTGNAIAVSLSGGDATSAAATGAADLSGVLSLGANDLTMNVAVDGGSAQTITINHTDTTAGQVLNDINATLTGAKASLVNTGGHSFLEITSDTTGVGSSVAVTDTGAHPGATTLFGAASTTATGQARSLTSLEQAINQSIAGNATLQAAGLKATDNGAGKLELVSNNGTYFQLNSFGSTAAANVGFGTAGASFGAGNVQTAAGFSSLVAGGSYQTSPFAFTGLTHGNDAQTITLTATDPDGAQHTQTVQLEDNGANRNAQTIDQAVASINSALQKSNVASLQGITAVEDNSSGTPQIQFISNGAFAVSIGSNANGTGIQSQGTNNVATVSGSGSTADISNVNTATAAVTALANAVNALGSAQAVVGQGENQFNYAVNLAQSQLTNFSAAESQIRDANLAMESANLTKAQIQMQAGVAALAQANSAPQQLLSLLQGH